MKKEGNEPNSRKILHGWAQKDIVEIYLNGKKRELLKSFAHPSIRYLIVVGEIIVWQGEYTIK